MSFCKIVKNKQHHLKVLLNSFHLNGHTRVLSTDSKVKPYYLLTLKSLGVKGLLTTMTVTATGEGNFLFYAHFKMAN